MNWKGIRGQTFVLTAVSTLAITLSSCNTPTRVVGYYGDSLGIEAVGPFELALASHAQVKQYARGGTAPCDWFSAMAAEARSPTFAVMISFSGNAMTPCMKDRLPGLITPARISALYAKDLAHAADLFPASTKVFLSTSPASKFTSHGSNIMDYAEAEAAQARPSHAVYVDAGTAVENANRGFTPTMACLSFEDAARGCHDGSIAVREPAGLHFCTDGWQIDGSCPHYSSGALRFGMAQAAALLRIM